MEWVLNRLVASLYRCWQFRSSTTLCEDVRLRLCFVRRVLVLVGHRSVALEVPGPEQALPVMEDWHPALVIIDVLLPAMNGIDLAIRIKSQWPACHLSLLSGQAVTDELLDTALRNGHRFDVVAKPVHPSELLGMAGRVLHEEPGSISENN